MQGCLRSLAIKPSELEPYEFSAQPVDELQNGARLGLDDTLHHDFAEREFLTAIAILSLLNGVRTLTNIRCL